MRLVAFCVLLLFQNEIARADDPQRIADSFRALTKASQWTLIEGVPIKFRTYHPQGMARVGDTFYVSSVEAIDRAAGKGVGRLFEMTHGGELLRTLTLGEGAMYHPGGIDFDGERIWVSVAEYRPDSRSIVYRVDPAAMEATEVFRFDDHLGAITFDRSLSTLVGVNWGSRKFYRWRVNGDTLLPENPGSPELVVNPSHYVDFQDVQVLSGTGLVLFTGLSGFRRTPDQGGPFSLGGIELFALADLRPVHQVPIPLWTTRGQPMTQNPVHIEAGEKGLRVYFMPEDDESTLYIYDVN